MTCWWFRPIISLHFPGLTPFPSAHCSVCAVFFIPALSRCLCRQFCQLGFGTRPGWQSEQNQQERGISFVRDEEFNSGHVAEPAESAGCVDRFVLTGELERREKFRRAVIAGTVSGLQSQIESRFCVISQLVRRRMWIFRHFGAEKKFAAGPAVSSKLARQSHFIRAERSSNGSGCPGASALCKYNTS